MPGDEREKFTPILKTVVVGAERVGKTRLVSRLAGDEFNDSYIPTIGIDFRIYIANQLGPRKDLTTKFQLWDTAGQERFSSILVGYYRDVDVVMFVLDPTQELEGQRRRLEQLNQEILQRASKKVAKFLVVSKLDLGEEQVVREEDVATLAKALEVPEFGVVRCSAKTGAGVDNLKVALNQPAEKKALDEARREQAAASEFVPLKDRYQVAVEDIQALCGAYKGHLDEEIKKKPRDQLLQFKQLDIQSLLDALKTGDSPAEHLLAFAKQLRELREQKGSPLFTHRDKGLQSFFKWLSVLTFGLGAIGLAIGKAIQTGSKYGLRGMTGKFWKTGGEIATDQAEDICTRAGIRPGQSSVVY